MPGKLGNHQQRASAKRQIHQQAAAQFLDAFAVIWNQLVRHEQSSEEAMQESIIMPCHAAHLTKCLIKLKDSFDGILQHTDTR